MPHHYPNKTSRYQDLLRSRFLEGLDSEIKKPAVIGLQIRDSCELDLSRTDPKDWKILDEV